MADPPLAAALLDAAEWFDGALRARLAVRGWPALSRNQAQVFPLLEPDGTAQATIARRLGITRQSAHTLLRQLEELGILERQASPNDRRLVLVHLTRAGRRLARDARDELADLEEELGRRIGADAVAALARAVHADWGEPPAPR